MTSTIEVSTPAKLRAAGLPAASVIAFQALEHIGFVIGAAHLPLPSWAQGLILLSLPDAVITKTYAPILILGAVGGLIIGFIVGKWGV